MWYKVIKQEENHLVSSCSIALHLKNAYGIMTIKTNKFFCVLP